jgi:hypothetical protein
MKKFPNPVTNGTMIFKLRMFFLVCREWRNERSALLEPAPGISHTGNSYGGKISVAQQATFLLFLRRSDGSVTSTVGKCVPDG